MQPSNSKKYKSLEQSLLDVFQKDRFLVLPYFGILRAKAIIPIKDNKQLDIDLNHVELVSDATCAASDAQINRVARQMDLSVFDAKVLLNQWIGIIKSDLRSQSLWSSPTFGTLTSNADNVSFSFKEPLIEDGSNIFYGLGKVDIPSALELVPSNTRDSHGSSTTNTGTNVSNKDNESTKPKHRKLRKQSKIGITSARALAASFVLGMVTLSLFSFEGNRVGSPVYEMLHPQNTTYAAPQKMSTKDEAIYIQDEPSVNTPSEKPVKEESPLPLTEEKKEEKAKKENLPQENAVSQTEAVDASDIDESKRIPTESASSFVVLGSFSNKTNAKRAIRQFEALGLPNTLTYKYNGTYFRVGLHHSLEDWKEINKNLDLPYWVLR